ncbi:MAG TPA: transcription antitermination factor NusB [Acidobacteriota bacterium]
MNFITPAAQVLREYFQEPQTNLRMLLTRFLQNYPGSDKNALTRTVYGVVRKDISLEHVIGLFLKNRKQAPPMPTHVLLKIAVFLLLYSDSYPEYAVVNEAVNAAAGKEKPFVNAVLRQLLRRKREIGELLDRPDNPVLKYAIAPLLLAGLRHISAATDSDLEYLDREPAFHLRFNPGHMTMAQARQTLAAAGIPCRELPQLDCFETTAAGQVLEKPEQLGGFYVQNTGSQAVSLVAASWSDKAVCDVAAAPGGKSLTLACLRPDLEIWASDISPQRLRLLEQNVRRLGLKNISAFTADIFKYPAGREAADLIILDAPCTSSGTLRKNPDLKNKIGPELVRANARQQQLMLASLAVRFPRARILYAVCSFLAEESEEVVEKTAAARGLRPVAVSVLLEKLGFRLKKAKYGCYLLPSDLNNDLFYISLLEPRDRNK